MFALRVGTIPYFSDPQYLDRQWNTSHTVGLLALCTKDSMHT